MSRSNYSDNCDGWALVCWRGAVNAAIRGRRGQAFLREMAAALDAMPDKILISGALEHDGEFCALGVVGAARGIQMGGIDPEDYEHIAATFGIAEAMSREIMFVNDEGGDPDPERRWRTVRNWVADQRGEGAM